MEARNDHIEVGDSRQALGWIRRSRLPAPAKRILSRFVRRFGEARFYRELPAHHDQVEALLGRGLPRWYRRIREVLAFVAPDQLGPVYLSGEAGGWHRFDLCGADPVLPEDRLRNPVIPLASGLPAGGVLGLRASGRRIWRAWPRDQQRRGKPRRMTAAYADYLALLGAVDGVRLADGRALWAPSRRVSAWFDRGDKALDLGERSAAIDALSRAVAIDPTHRNSWFRLGVALHEAGRLADALDALQRSLACPGSPFRNQWWYLAEVLLAFDRNAEALDALERAIAVGPADASLHFRHCTTLWRLARYDDALAAIDRSIAMKPAKDHHIHLAWRAQVLGKLAREEEAWAAWMDTTRLRPDYAVAWLNGGLSAYRAGNYDRAVATYSQGLARFPDDAGLWFNQACSRAMRGERSSALFDLAQAIRLDPARAPMAREDADFERMWADPDFLALTAGARS